jgi:hypothetical protein
MNSEKPYYIQEIPDIIVRNGEYCLIVKKPLELKIYGEETKIDYIPLGIYIENNIKEITLGETDFKIEFSTTENDSRFLVEHDYHIVLGPNEKKKILKYVVSRFIDKTHLVDDYSKKEDFFDPENIPKPTMAQMLSS